MILRIDKGKEGMIEKGKGRESEKEREGMERKGKEKGKGREGRKGKEGKEERRKNRIRKAMVRKLAPGALGYMA